MPLLRHGCPTAQPSSLSQEAHEATGAGDAARVREILAKHQPRQLDPAVEKELHEYLNMVRQRTMADFEAAEWEQ